MKKNYNVLWFDDEYQTLDIINEKAMLADINLVGFSNAEDGLKELRNNFNNYDAVIVDGIFYKSNNILNAQVTQNAMAEVATELKKLEHKRKLPWYILSGQASFTKEKNQFADFFRNNKVYDKLSDEDLDDLWKSLKRDADSQFETQIRHKYADIFELCSSNYIGDENYERILRLLEAVEKNDNQNPIYYNEIRKVIESVFLCCDNKNLFPDECTTTNKRSKFLGEKAMLKYVPVYIQRSIHSIVDISQDGSHFLATDGDVSKGYAPYLLKSTVFELLNILLWFKEFSDRYPKGLEINLETIPNIELEQNWIQGELAEISYNGWGTFLSVDGTWSIPPQMIKQYGFQVGDELEITTKADNNKHIDKIRRIEVK